MKNRNLQSEDSKLSGLLRQARAEPPLALGFQESVWRRIERSARRDELAGADWVGRMVETLLRPRLALAGLLAMLLMGSCFGIVNGFAQAHKAAQARYLQAVAPNLVR